jgi:hypothetical protein
VLSYKFILFTYQALLLFPTSEACVMNYICRDNKYTSTGAGHKFKNVPVIVAAHGKTTLDKKMRAGVIGRSGEMNTFNKLIFKN